MLGTHHFSISRKIKMLECAFYNVLTGFSNFSDVSNLFKLSISMGKFEIIMHFKKFHVKIVKSGPWKSGCHGNDLIGAGIINAPLSSPINFMKSHQISLL